MIKCPLIEQRERERERERESVSAHSGEEIAIKRTPYNVDPGNRAKLKTDLFFCSIHSFLSLPLSD